MATAFQKHQHLLIGLYKIPEVQNSIQLKKLICYVISNNGSSWRLKYRNGLM